MSLAKNYEPNFRLTVGHIYGEIDKNTNKKHMHTLCTRPFLLPSKGLVDTPGDFYLLDDCLDDHFLSGKEILDEITPLHVVTCDQIIASIFVNCILLALQKLHEELLFKGMVFSVH